MTSPVPLIARLQIIISTLFWSFLFIVFLLGLPVLLDISPKVAAGFAVTALILAIIVSWLIRWASYTQSTRSFFVVLIKPFFLLLFVLTGLATLPIYYLAYKVETDPLLMPRAELSNGEKTLVLQGMIHIGNDLFYKSVIYDLETALDEGYKLFYEGVKPSSAENDAWFARTVAGGDLGEKYKDMARVCGVNLQLDYFQLMAHDMEKNPERHLTADVDTAQLKAEYDRLMRDDNAFAFSVNQSRVRGDKNLMTQYFGTIIDRIKRSSEGQQRVAGVICRGIFAIALNPEKYPDDPLNKLILNFRNTHLVNTILTDPSQKIYVTYGAAHLPGVVALLRAADPRWEVKSVKWLRDMTHPQDDHGSDRASGIDIIPFK